MLDSAVADQFGSGYRHDSTNLDSGCFHGIVAVAVVAAADCCAAVAAVDHMKWLNNLYGAIPAKVRKPNFIETNSNDNNAFKS